MLTLLTILQIIWWILAIPLGIVCVVFIFYGGWFIAIMYYCLGDMIGAFGP
jgi:hypothetical protein